MQKDSCHLERPQQYDDAFHFYSDARNVPLKLAMADCNNAMMTVSSTSAYVLATAQFLSTMLLERSELLGGATDHPSSISNDNGWGGKIPASSADKSAPFAIQLAVCTDTLPYQSEATSAGQSESNSEEEEEMRFPHFLSSNISVEDDGDDEDAMFLCLTSKYIVLEESIPGTAESSVSSGYDTDSDAEDSDDDEDEDSSKYELFEDVSVLTADSSSSQVVEDADDNSESDEDDSSCDSQDDCDATEAKDDCSIPNHEDDGKDLNVEVPIPDEDYSSDEYLKLFEVAQWQVELPFLAAIEPSAVIAHATEDPRLMTFLLDLCARNSG